MVDEPSQSGDMLLGAVFGVSLAAHLIKSFLEFQHLLNVVLSGSRRL
ncbi:MAG TPA: hypothetical protein VLA51_09050 [Paracoccaceae bacterium]|nr:hypothetical protein [Paracoccaceae bacterium]